MSNDAPRRGIALMVAAMACFALSDLLAKRLTASQPVLEVVWFRYLALAASLALVRLRGRPWQPSPHARLQAGRALCIAASAVLFNAGLARLPLAAATALVFSSPLFVMALSMIVLRERVAPTAWGWALLGFGGVVIVAHPGAAGFDSTAALLPIASSLAWAGAMVMTRRLAARDAALTTQAWSCGIGLLVLTALLPLEFRVPEGALQIAELAAMAACWSTAQWLVIHAYARGAASLIAPFAYSQLFWANLFGFAFLGQRPDAPTLIGTAAILLAGIGVATGAARGPRSRPAPLSAG
jgi:drug/metabolite transporter (DMT)-like permease